MRVLLLYFSGTGHTERCALALADALAEQGHEAVLYRYRSDAPLPYEVGEFDLLGIGYPIHAFNVPEAFHRFLKALPSAQKPYFIFKVSGEPFHVNDASSYHSFRALRKKGYALIAEKHFLMPYNIMFRYKDALAKQMALYLKPLCKAFVLGILEERPERIKYRWDRVVFSFLLRIEWIAPKCNSPFIRVKKDCVSCEKCVRDCPTGAIVRNEKGRLVFQASKCAMCMRCAMECPVDAISYGFMNPWKVHGSYPFEKLLSDPSIDPHFVHEGMKGYFRLFLPYFRKADALLRQYGIPDPLA